LVVCDGRLRLLRRLTGDVFAAFDLGGEPLLVFLADVTLVALFDGRVLEGATLGLCDGVGIEEGLPSVVSPLLHALKFRDLEGVHGNGADEGDVHAEAAVSAGAVQADEGTELRGGLDEWEPTAREMPLVNDRLYNVRDG
jgi:hypothetical protein